jgi:hypothetical protein
VRLAAACLLVLLPAFAQAAAPVSLKNGMNRIDFTGDGRADEVIVAHRENFNAHGFEVVTFHVEDGDTLLQVPLFDGDDERQFATISGGADCTLHDLRLLPGTAGAPMTLIVADRALGDSYADPNTVTFTWYALRTNGDVGYPQFRFARTRTTQAKTPFCDVGDAFDATFGKR